MNIERGLILAIFLGVINIALNTTVYKAVQEASTFAQAIMSPMFWLAFVIGTISLMCMLGMYLTNYSLARGVLIAGATSILLGTLWGLFLGKSNLSMLEWLLWGGIAAFYVARFVSISRS